MIRFNNEVQAKAHQKATKEKVSMANIAMALSEGNKKLQDSDKVSFYQWNITSVVSCPYRTPMCEKSCYALKAERIYPTVAKRRDLNLEFSRSSEFVSSMIEQIEYELTRKRNQGKTVYFRIHESGDFYSQEYMNKWVEIANHFAENESIIFMAYTKSLPFVKQALKKYGDDNVHITFKSSIWADTREKFVKMTRDIGMSVFTAIPKGEVEQNGFVACPSSDTFKGTDKAKDCGACGMCYTKDIDIAIEIH